MSRSLKAHILLVLVTFAWGATFVVIKDALANVSPLVFNALRMASGAVALGVIFWGELRAYILQGLKPANPSADGARLKSCPDTTFTRGDAARLKSCPDTTFTRGDAARLKSCPDTGPESSIDTKYLLLGGALLGAFLWAGYSCQTVGLQYTTPSKSAFITGMFVVLVPVIVAVSGRKLPSGWTVIGVVAAFVGLYLLTIGPNVADPASPKRGEMWGTIGINFGDLITLGSAICFALHIYVLGRLTQRYPFKVLSVLQVVVSAVLMGATIPLERPRLVLTPQAVFAILFTGLVCTAAAFSIQAWAQQFTPPTHTALIFVLEPVFAALTSYVLLGEHLGARGTVGAILILGGILVSELKGTAVEPAGGTGAEFSIN